MLESDTLAGDTIAGDKHHGPTLQAYLVIFGALCVFTLVSFVVNATISKNSAHAGMAIILGVAVCKAALVGMFFMHLKYEWAKLYFLIIPVAILCVMMIIVLMPDGVATWPQDPVPGSLSSLENK
jgi:cytochrome c oxidase subunit IV